MARVRPVARLHGPALGEATALRVCDIDLARRRIDVRRAFSDVGGRIVLGTPKSHQSRTVPVPRFLAREIAAAMTSKTQNCHCVTRSGKRYLSLAGF